MVNFSLFCTTLGTYLPYLRYEPNVIRSSDTIPSLASITHGLQALSWLSGGHAGRHAA